MSRASPRAIPTSPGRSTAARHRSRGPPPRSRHFPDTLPASPRTIPTPPGRHPATARTQPGAHGYCPVPGPDRPEARWRPHNNRLFDPANGPLLVKFRENPLDARTASRQPAGRFTPRAGPVPLVAKSHPRRTQISGNIPNFPNPQKKRPR